VGAVLAWQRFCHGSGFNREIAVWAHPGDIASLNFAATSLVLLESGNLRSRYPAPLRFHDARLQHPGYAPKVSGGTTIKGFVVRVCFLPEVKRRER
jgi:hypothetical protein